MKNLLEAHNRNFDDFLFYDIECFAEDTLIVFKDIDGNTVAKFHNNFEKVEELIEGKVLVGYNNFYYDDFMLSGILAGADVYKLKYYNDLLINKERLPISVNSRINSLDCFQQINVARSSLKKVEANIGMSIDETSVDFNIERPLTDKELKDTFKYCEQDVNATITIFKLRWFSYFIPKIMIVDMIEDEDIKKKAIRWNTTTITAYLLTGNSEVSKWDSIMLGRNVLDNDIMLNKVPYEVQEMWRNDGKKLTHREKGCIFEFSQGGLHGVNETSKKKFNNVKLLDVTSLYPNILIKINALGKATEKYKSIVNRRIKVKHSDIVLSNALKLVINSTYGLMKNEYSKLYNPKAALSVCIYGQIILYDLCIRLAEAGFTLVNVNTDGVAFCGKVPDSEWEAVKEEWEKEYGFELELSEFKTWIQKDVNNYVAVTESGNIKVKGGEVNHYYDPVDYLSDPLHLKSGVNWSGSNTKSIIHHCVVNKLIYDKDFVDTITDNLNYPILFQYVLQCGSTYVGTVDENGNQYQKVNRVFATKKGVTLKKLKETVNKNGDKKTSLQYFPNAPKDMYVYNGDLRDFDNFKDIVDVDFYTALAEEKYSKLWR